MNIISNIKKSLSRERSSPPAINSPKIVLTVEKPAANFSPIMSPISSNTNINLSDSNSNLNSLQLNSKSESNHLPKRSSSVRRLPFAYIKSSTDNNSNPTNNAEFEKPNTTSNQLDNDYKLYSNYNSLNVNNQNHVFVRHSYKTSSFHNYRRVQR